jgi:hypothetical protein
MIQIRLLTPSSGKYHQDGGKRLLQNNAVEIPH